jgi:hypothetical protein
MFGAPPPTQDPPPEPPPEQSSGNAAGVALLQQILGDVQRYIDGEQDEEDKLTGEKVTSLLQQLLAKNQKETDGLLQGKMSPAAMRGAFGA